MLTPIQESETLTGGSSVTLIDTGKYGSLLFRTEHTKGRFRLWPHWNWNLLRRTVPRVGNDCGAQG